MKAFFSDRYFLFARLFPAIICSIPFFVFYYYFLHPLVGSFSESFLNAQWPGDVTASVALVYLLALGGRAVAKDLFEKHWFKRDETRMPTTEFLLHSHGEYSPEFKRKIHDKISSDFQITIRSVEEEADDEDSARKIIAESVTLIRQRVKDGRLLLQHNIEYGFFRNLVGGAVLAVAMSAVDSVLFAFIHPDNDALVISVVLIVLYAIPILISKTLLTLHGKRYARVLIQEYLSIG